MEKLNGMMAREISLLHDDMGALLPTQQNINPKKEAVSKSLFKDFKYANQQNGHRGCTRGRAFLQTS
jgi:hypothetical protein